jgi:hypothetical protein
MQMCRKTLAIYFRTILILSNYLKLNKLFKTVLTIFIKFSVNKLTDNLVI